MNLPIEVPDWTRAIQLVGSDPSGNPVLVALDADGNIIAIMKATYSGVLKDVACDAEGRMIMIPTDPADVWGNAISMGNAELAARLKGLGDFDRRGSVVFRDDFEQGLAAFQLSGSLAGYAAALTTSETLHGGFSCKLTAPSGDSQSVILCKIYTFVLLSRLGADLSFRLGDNVKYVRLSLTYFDGSAGYIGSIRYDVANDKWEYLTSVTSWATLLTSAGLDSVEGFFFNAKVVIDPENSKYVRALASEQEIDMSSYALYVYPSAATPRFQHEVMVYSLGATQGWIYLDNVGITQGEPA